MAVWGETQEVDSELARELRRLRNDSGLTLAALARCTSYSKSSWERYLNGKMLPPKQAVVAFARAVGVPAEPLLRLQGAAAEADGEGEQPEHVSAVSRPESWTRPEESPGTRPGSVPEPGEAHQAGSPARPAGAWRGGGRSRLRGGRFGVLPVAVAVAVATSGFSAGLLADRFIGEGATTSELAASQGPKRAETDVVGCTGFECEGKDSQRLGCHIGVWTAAVAREGEALVELRYSPSCRAAWGRITEGEVGDVVRVEAVRGSVQERAIKYDHDTYSPMVEAPYPAAARACAELTGGRELCTPHGGASPLPEDSTNEAHKD